MKLLKKVGVTAALALAAQVVSAAPVTNWNWSLDSAFTSWTGAVTASGSVFDNDGTGTTFIGNSKMTWGTDVGFGQSSLEITNPNLTTANGSATPFNLVETAVGSGVYTDTVSGTLAIHKNRPIQAGSGSLSSFVMTEYFRLVPTGFDPVGAPALAGMFEADFLESPNSSDLSCCDDIFVIADGSLLDNVASFEQDGYKYVVSLSAVGLGVLTDAQCAELGYASGCAGLVTEENATNNFQFMITLTASAVSVAEPSLFALMGLGLIGVAIRRRRRTA